jgi:hypothetical protein
VLLQLAELRSVGAREPARFVLTQSRRRNRPNRLAREHLGHERVRLGGLEHALLVAGCGLALGRADQTRTQLDPAGAERKRGQETASVRKAAGGDHGHAHGVDDLGHERQRRHGPDVPARLAARGDDRIGSLLLHAARVQDARHDGDDDDPRPLQPRDDRGPGIATPRRHDGDLELDGDLRARLGERGAHRRDVHPEGPVGELAGLLDVAAQLLLGTAEGRQNAQPAGLADGRSEVRAARSLHRPLQDRMANAEQVAEDGVEQGSLRSRTRLRSQDPKTTGRVSAREKMPIRIQSIRSPSSLAL